MSIFTVSEVFNSNLAFKGIRFSDVSIENFTSVECEIRLNNNQLERIKDNLCWCEYYKFNDYALPSGYNDIDIIIDGCLMYIVIDSQDKSIIFDSIV